jgi:hypothetical protein
MPTIVLGEGGLLLGSLKGVDFNVTTDQLLAMMFARYIVRRIVVNNASINLTLAVGGFYTAAAKGGTAIVANTQVYTALTAAAKFLDVTLAAILGTDVRTESILYFSLTTAQGAAATGDIYIYGDPLP